VSHPFDATLKDIFSHGAADLTPLLHLPTGAIRQKARQPRKVRRRP
jgi:hypothetical protein